MAHRVLFVLAVVAVVIGVVDLQAPAQSRSAMEGAILLVVAVVMAVAATVMWRRASKRCPQCAETVKRAARKCRHCGAELA